MNIINISPDDSAWALLQPPIGWDLIEGGEEEDLYGDEDDDAFEEFELEAEDLETDWEEID